MRIRRQILLLLFLISVTAFALGDKNENLSMSDKIKIQKEMEYFKVYDPFEGFNQRIYYFNYGFDKYIFLPAVNLYKFVTPEIARKGVTNFFENTENITTTVNSIAQGKVKKALRSIGRFTMNIAFGFGGILDAGKSFGMPTPYEDFGLTLAHYGVGRGPYLVLPILGPSNLRDAFGKSVDSLATKDFYKASDTRKLNSAGITVLEAINTRGNNDFRYFESGEAFEYEYVKFLYTKYRMLQEEEK